MLRRRWFLWRRSRFLARRSLWLLRLRRRFLGFGRSEGLGRPLLYGTTPLFLELLGLPDLANLPRAEELTIALQPYKAETAGPDDESAAYVSADA